MSRRPSAQALAVERGALVAIVAVFLAPVAWMIATAYKPPRDIFSIPPTLAFTPTLTNFANVFRYFDLARLIESSLIISLGAAILSLAIGVPAGYALARARTRWAIGVAYFFLAVRTVPPVATLLPFYLMMRDVGLLGGWWSVILIDATLNTAFVVWMMFSYFRGLPREVEEAALTDGCTLPGCFLRVALPLVRPGIVASALLCVMFAWNDFLYSSFLTRAESKPISVALLTAYGTKDISWGTLGALAHFSTIPIVLIALLLNRYFVQGLTRGVH
ncbi:MAG TPA: carbohydrate ABC transporter permease [Roseiarcus sp.]|jgi:multiple sugar transport system permease protein|nr:carbohydrate ABC transporter permease [Roseiarcus sp.]